MHLFAVGDGHGVNGHFASQYIKQKLPGKYFSKIINICLSYVEHFINQCNKHDDLTSSSNLQRIDDFYTRVP